MSDPNQSHGSARALPHNLELEQALLGALIVHPDTWAHVGAGLQPEHFFEPVHARIFCAVATLSREGAPVSPLTLKTYFERDEALAVIGGWEYLVRLTSCATVSTEVAEFGRIIRDLAARRSVIGLAGELLRRHGTFGLVKGLGPQLQRRSRRSAMSCTEARSVGRRTRLAKPQSMQ